MTNESLNDACERLNSPALQGVCKDCGNSSMNNDTNPAFEERVDDDNGYDYLVCIRCGSEHLDIL